jgi:hypothetical protein
MKFPFKKFLPHILVIITFIIVAVGFFNPVLSENDTPKIIPEEAHELLKGFPELYLSLS